MVCWGALQAKNSTVVHAIAMKVVNGRIDIVFYKSSNYFNKYFTKNNNIILL